MIYNPRTKLWAIPISLALTYPLFQGVMVHPYYSKKKYPKKTVIVTGATGNTGKAACFQLGVQKARVIMACRDMEKCKAVRRALINKTGHRNYACRHLDLEDISSINKFADEMIETEPRIDALVNLATVRGLKEKTTTKHGVEKNYFVNFLAPYLLTIRLLDKLEETGKAVGDARIVNVIGVLKKEWKIDLDDINFEKRKYSSRAAYEQSKLALAYFTILLDKRLRDRNSPVFAYGTSPCSDRLSASLHEPANEWETFSQILSHYTRLHPDMAMGSTVRCALDWEYGIPEQSGKYYTIFGTYWGWRGIDKNESLMKLVWNAAADLLLALK